MIESLVEIAVAFLLQWLASYPRLAVTLITGLVLWIGLPILHTEWRYWLRRPASPSRRPRRSLERFQWAAASRPPARATMLALRPAREEEGFSSTFFMEHLLDYYAKSVRDRVRAEPRGDVRTQVSDVEDVVVGAMSLSRLEPEPGAPEGTWTFACLFEARILECFPGRHGRVPVWVRELWGLRARQGSSPGSWELEITGTEILEEGVWPFEPELIRQPPDGGSSLQTLAPKDYAARRQAFLDRHPGFDERRFNTDVRAFVLALFADLDRGELLPVESRVTRAIHQRFRYRVESLRAAGLRHLHERIEVTNVAIVDHGRDPYFEWITVRVWVSSRDHILDWRDRLRAGSRSKEYSFSEYWTFVHPAGSDAVHTPEFSWKLAHIEPAASYVCD